MRHDLEVELERNKLLPTDDWMGAHYGLIEQVQTASSAEGAQKTYAYVEYLRLATMALMRAYRLCDARQVPGKGDSPR
jgi:hypothetical protein